MLRKVKRRVLLQLGGRVYCGERRKRTEVNNKGGSNQRYLAGYVASARSAFCHSISWLQLTALENRCQSEHEQFQCRRPVNPKGTTRYLPPMYNITLGSSTILFSHYPSIQNYKAWNSVFSFPTLLWLRPSLTQRQSVLRASSCKRAGRPGICDRAYGRQVRSFPPVMCCQNAHSYKS